MRHPIAIVGMAAFFVLALFRWPLFADEPQGARSNSAAPGGQPATAQQAPRVPPPVDGKERREALARGMLMLTGIIITGIALLAFVAIWGNRARRRARQALPPAGRGDELWFLKPHRKPEHDGPPAPSDDSRSANGET